MSRYGASPGVCDVCSRRVHDRMVVAVSGACSGGSGFAHHGCLPCGRKRAARPDAPSWLMDSLADLEQRESERAQRVSPLRERGDVGAALVPRVPDRGRLADASRVVGTLSQMAERLPRTLGRLDVLLRSLDGTLRSERGTLGADLAEAYGGLADAGEAARALHAALSRTLSALGHISHQDEARSGPPA